MKKNRIAHILPLLFILGISLITNSCTPEKDDDPVTVTDKIFYEQIAYTLTKCYTDIHNQNLAGKPTGAQNITTTAPMGGNLTITGSNSYDKDHNITTADLTFTLTNVIANSSSTSESGETTCTTQITITGTTTYKGSFSTTYTSLSHLSQNLHVVGSVTYAGTVRTIDKTGQVSINRTSTVSANIFGNNVSW